MSSVTYEHHRFTNLLDVLRFRAAADSGSFRFLDATGAVESKWSMRELLRHSFGVARALDRFPRGSRIAIVHPPGLP